MARMVYCVKLKRELPGLDKPPFPGPLGQRIYEHISKQAYEMWPAQSTLLINHYNLNLADPQARKLLRQEMEKFFFEDADTKPEGWTPENPAEAQQSAAGQQPAAPQGPRLVYCVKLGRELPGLDKPPFPGKLGQRIYEQISKQAYEMWEAQRTLIINHYGLNLADPEARKILREQMEEFFFGGGGQMPEGWTPEAEPAGAGAPRRKGGGGPARKK